MPTSPSIQSQHLLIEYIGGPLAGCVDNIAPGDPIPAGNWFRSGDSESYHLYKYSDIPVPHYAWCEEIKQTMWPFAL